MKLLEPSGHQKPQTVAVGTAGWGLSREQQEHFGSGDSVLQRYATRFNAAEINSSFYRPHRPATYARWAASVPQGFRFSVKIPKAVTHTAKLRDCAAPLAEFVEQVSHLGENLGPLLVQLPPSLSFERDVVEDFFGVLHGMTPARTVCEPRHASWFTPEVDVLLRNLNVSCVAADPAKVPAAAHPGGSLSTVYYRWHGSPKMYSSSYSDSQLAKLAAQVQALPGDVWVIFDNTAAGAAVENGLTLRTLLTSAQSEEQTSCQPDSK